jgi:hypothetical protein
MRRLLLGAFLLCAACGGGVRSANPGAATPDPSAEQRAERTSVALSADGQAIVATYEKTFGQDAVESCLQQWIEDDGSPDPGLAYKPDIAFFRAFSGRVPGCCSWRGRWWWGSPGICWGGQ